MNKKSNLLLFALLLTALTVPWRAKAQTGNIDFADSRVKNLCVYYWDTDNDKELSYTEAAAVSSLRVPGQNYSVFQAAHNITSFNELQHFTKLNTIESRAFYNCTSLTSVTIPNSVTSIEQEAFRGCTGLTSITLSNAITSIGNSAFQGCKNLPSIGIPNSVTNIVSMAFYNCTGLTSIEIPSSVTSIGGYAFSGCTGLTSITVGATTPPSVGDLAFNNVNKSIPVYVPCESVNDYQTATGWSEFTDIQRNGSFICFADDNVKAICVANWDTDHDEELSYTEAAAVTELGMVFKSNSDIVFFDELQYFTGLTSIGISAFYCCTGLTSIEIPSSVTTIGYGVFMGCTGLTSIEIPSSVTTIGYGAFSFCTGLTSITVGATTPPSVGDLAFNNVNKSIHVYVPCESVNDYQTATGWSEFTNIVGMDCDLPSINVWLDDYYDNSRAEFEWSHNSITLAEGQSILYDCSMGTVSGEEVTWTDMGSTTAYYIGTPTSGTLTSGVFKCYLPVGDYTFRTRIRIVDGNTTIATGEWYEILEPFSIVTANPVNNYPFTFGFEGYAHNFLQGLNLSGSLENVNRFEFGTVATTGIVPHGDGSSYLCFHHDGNESHEASVVLPMFYNSSQTELAVSFWLYTNTAPLQGVRLEYSPDGENWSTEDYLFCNICDNAWNRFVYKINLVGEAPVTPHVYVRLRFVCSETYSEQFLCLDDISVQPLSNYKPYITDATSTANSVTLSVIDNAYENGSGSQRFEVDYRVVGTDSWTPKAFDNEEPYEQFVQLTVDGLEPNTNYEFRAFSLMPNASGNTTIWSESSNIYSQWTDNAPLFIVSQGQPYEFGFETYASGWTVPEGWNTYYDGGYESDHCAHTSTKNEELISPEIGFHESCDNVIIRFWAKGGASQIAPALHVYSSDDDFASVARLNWLQGLSDDTWTEYVYSLCGFMSGSVKIGFDSRNFEDFSIDNIEIVANAYHKVIGDGISANSNWVEDKFYPQGLPTYADNVLVCGDNVYMNQTQGMANNIEFGTEGKLRVSSGKSLVVNNTLTANKANALHVSGTVMAGELVPQAEGSVEVNDGGVIRAVEIAGEDYTASPNLVINDGGQVYCSTPFFGTYYKNITGYGAENVNQSTGWNLIAPLESGGSFGMGFVPMNGEEYVIEQMDLYGFDQSAELEWINKKNAYYNNGNDVRYLIVESKEGYLYARQDDGTLDFRAIGGPNIFRATTQDVEYDALVYDAEAAFAGWNLIGNPYTANAYVKDAEGNAMDYYRMNAAGDRIVLADAGTPIKPCEGVFVQVTGSGNSVYFTTTQPQSGRGAMDFTVSKHSSTRNGVSASATPIDRARISFSQGKGMGHLDLMADANRLYIPQSGKDMAVVCSEPAGEMPLNFEAAENGTYTLGISLNDTELVYCHLIDNLTGADVDLLATSTGSVAEYTFEAKTTDYTSRFKVVFAAKSAFEGDNASNFAFYNGSAWVVNASADATVQVIDMMGRVVLSTDVARNVSTKGMAPGVYVMRLIDGKDVKTQKIVVR